MRKEGRLREAIDMFELAGKSPSYMAESSSTNWTLPQVYGRPWSCIQAFRTALSDQSASRNEVIDVQYFLARTLESVGQIEEAATLYRRIAQTNPYFKDAARRAKELSPKLKRPTNGKREATRQWVLVRQRHREFQPAYRQSQVANVRTLSISQGISPARAVTKETTPVAQ